MLEHEPEKLSGGKTKWPKWDGKPILERGGQKSWFQRRGDWGMCETESEPDWFSDSLVKTNGDKGILDSIGKDGCGKEGSQRKQKTERTAGCQETVRATACIWCKTIPHQVSCLNEHTSTWHNSWIGYVETQNRGGLYAPQGETLGNWPPVVPCWRWTERNRWYWERVIEREREEDFPATCLPSH